MCKLRSLCSSKCVRNAATWAAHMSNAFYPGIVSAWTICRHQVPQQQYDHPFKGTAWLLCLNAAVLLHCIASEQATRQCWRVIHAGVFRCPCTALLLRSDVGRIFNCGCGCCGERTACLCAQCTITHCFGCQKRLSTIDDTTTVAHTICCQVPILLLPAQRVAPVAP